MQSKHYNESGPHGNYLGFLMNLNLMPEFNVQCLIHVFNEIMPTCSLTEYGCCLGNKVPSHRIITFVSTAHQMWENVIFCQWIEIGIINGVLQQSMQLFDPRFPMISPPIDKGGVEKNTTKQEIIDPFYF